MRFVDKRSICLPPHFILFESCQPTTAWKKADIQNWLHDKGIEFDQTDIKAELLLKSKTIQIVKEYKTDVIARESLKNIVVLRLPIGHCELNPIELI